MCIRDSIYDVLLQLLAQSHLARHKTEESNSFGSQSTKDSSGWTQSKDFVLLQCLGDLGDSSAVGAKALQNTIYTTIYMYMFPALGA